MNRLLSRSLLAAVALAYSGCSDKTCTPSNGDNSTPGPAFECAAGEVCYLGRCITTCSAGAELVEPCGSDNDCTGARPNCIRGFCSSCEGSDTCVPALNICRSVTEVVFPDPIDRPPEPPDVPRPLDAGFEPGGVARPLRDAGVVEQPEDRAVTRIAYVDLGRQRDYRVTPPVDSSVAEVRAFDTAIGTGPGLKWRADVDPPRVEAEFPDPAEDPDAPANVVDEFCELRQLLTVTGTAGQTATPADFGAIRMVNPTNFPGSIEPELIATFDIDLGRYQVTPQPIPTAFLTYSVSEPVVPRFVLVSGTPLPGVIALGWPETLDDGHHVPFELRPSAATEAALQAGFQVANPANQDLTFRYDRIESGNDGFEAVFVRVTGQRTELFCEQQEGLGLGGDMRVRAAILNAFRQAEGITSPRTYDLYFERASRELLQPAAADDQLVLVTVRIRHSLRARLTFQ